MLNAFYPLMSESYANYEWFLKADLTSYSGKWLAIINRKVVASGYKVSEVIQKAKEAYPSKKPLITKVRNKLSIL